MTTDKCTPSVNPEVISDDPPESWARAWLEERGLHEDPAISPSRYACLVASLAAEFADAIENERLRARYDRERMGHGKDERALLNEGFLAGLSEVENAVFFLKKADPESGRARGWNDALGEIAVFIARARAAHERRTEQPSDVVEACSVDPAVAEIAKTLLAERPSDGSCAHGVSLSTPCMTCIRYGDEDPRGPDHGKRALIEREREWWVKRAALEGASEVTAGVPNQPPANPTARVLPAISGKPTYDEKVRELAAASIAFLDFRQDDSAPVTAVPFMRWKRAVDDMRAEIHPMADVSLTGAPDPHAPVQQKK